MRSYFLDRYFCATFDSATFQNETTGLTRDPSSKPMSTSAVPGVWLVCSLWHNRSIISISSVFSKFYY